MEFLKSCKKHNVASNFQDTILRILLNNHKCGQAPLIYVFSWEISYSQPRSMRSPAVMSSAPCRWRPRCITAYPSLVRPGPNERCNRWNLQDPHCQGTDVGMRCENAGDQAHHWCHKTPRCTLFHTCWPMTPHINLAHEEFRVWNILFQDSAPAARQCSFQKYSH